jgi:DNA-binding NarL/FixJ family response regulator
MAIARKVAGSFRTQPSAEPLTRRENEVLTRLWQGQSYKSIADELYVSRETVKFHIKNIHRKLNVSNRVQAILKKP